MRFSSRLGLPLIVPMAGVLFGNANPATTSRPSIAASSRPAQSDQTDRQLSAAEKKAYLSELARSRRRKLEGIDDLRRELRLAAITIESDYEAKSKDTTQAIRVVQIKIASECSCKHRATSLGEQTEGNTSQGEIQRLTQDLETAKDQLIRRREDLIAVTHCLDVLEALYAASAEIPIQLRYGQHRKAAVYRERAESENRKLQNWAGSPWFDSQVDRLIQSVSEQYVASINTMAQQPSTRPTPR